MPSTPLEHVLLAIDALNSQDPHQDTVDGKPHSRELLYSKRLSAWVLTLNPNASDALRIAARGQHVARWTSPRSSYPMDRGGYLRWREDLKKFHAKTVVEMMQSAGYSADEQERVRLIIMKKNIKGDADTQTLEDALCLVFLETQFEDVKQKTPDDKMIEIIKKTWRKMSPQGQAAALALTYPPAHLVLIQQALK